MKLYRFRTFKSTYYFPPLTKKSKFIYSLYGNYGGKVAHLMWWMFMHSALFRWMNRVDAMNVDGYAQLVDLVGDDCVLGVNMGTTGPDQKKSVLGYSLKDGTEFFAKLATKERAMALSRNEIKVYQTLADTDLVPKLFDYQTEKNFVFLKCECIKGQHVHNQIDEQQLLDVLMLLKQRHYTSDASVVSDELDKELHPQLKTCFVHMDFCPWNMISVNGKLHVIDWEMANEMPLGFDLFTYLLQTHFLTENTMTGEDVIKTNEPLINRYFGTARADWQMYLDAFIDWKINFFSEGQNDLLLDRFNEMKRLRLQNTN